MARSFNGTSDVIKVNPASSAIGSLTMSLSLWIYPTSLAAAYVGLTTGTSVAYTLYLKSSGKLALYVAAGTGFDGPGNITLVTNTWYHVGITLGVNGGIISTVNNQLNFAAASASGNPSGLELWFGNDLNAATRWFQGRMADVAVWNNAQLSQGEMAALYNGIRPNRIRPRNLAGYWPLYGGGSVEPDLSVFRRNGILTGTTYAADPPQLQRTNLNSDILYTPGEGEMPALYLAPSFISGWSRQSNLPVIGGGTF